MWMSASMWFMRIHYSNKRPLAEYNIFNNKHTENKRQKKNTQQPKKKRINCRKCCFFLSFNGFISLALYKSVNIEQIFTESKSMTTMLVKAFYIFLYLDLSSLKYSCQEELRVSKAAAVAAAADGFDAQPIWHSLSRCLGEM